jgi:hypothetical protein
MRRFGTVIESHRTEDLESFFIENHPGLGRHRCPIPVRPVENDTSFSLAPSQEQFDSQTDKSSDQEHENDPHRAEPAGIGSDMTGYSPDRSS